MKNTLEHKIPKFLYEDKLKYFIEVSLKKEYKDNFNVLKYTIDELRKRDLINT